MFEMRYLSAAERAEYDQMFYDATHDASGVVLPTREFGERLRMVLEGALQSGRSWPQWLLDDLIEAGLKRRGKDWLKESEVISIANGESVFVSKSARIGVERVQEGGGDRAYQQVLWRELTENELRQIIRTASNRRKAEGITISTAKRLLKLCKKHGVDNVSAALALEGVTLDEFLGRAA